MNLTFAPRGILQIDDARITFKNFAGRGDKFNREGERNFALIIPTTDFCDALVNDKNKYGVGWNVKIKDPREEGDEPFMFLKVKVNFNEFGPNVYLISGNKKVRLTADTVGCLDDIYIDHVDLDISPSDGEVNGRPYRTAYLRSMQVIQDLTQDRFADHGYYEDEE
jgi:hypothetical protein